jgi:phosphoglucomutase
MVTGSASTRVHPRAGTLPLSEDLVDVPKLVDAYYTRHPDPSVPEQRIIFGTSGHRGSSLTQSFNEDHIAATSQAICVFRTEQGITGPLFLGRDPHALSEPAMTTALEVFAGNGVTVLVDSRKSYTPTPALSLAVLTHNAGRADGLADGVLLTPSHNPPGDGGYKYNPPDGGPAGTDVTRRIEIIANEILENGMKGVRRTSAETALAADTTQTYDFLDRYVSDLPNVVDVEAIRASGVRIGADPLGGASVAYWGEIASRYGIDLTVLNPDVDPTWRFMPLDWDGKIRMDCSSAYAMSSLIARRSEYDVIVANDADADRHGVVTSDAGLMTPNRYLSAAIDYLFRNRPDWSAGAAVGKTVVSSSMIDRIAADLGRPLQEVPVGFKWFVPGLEAGALGFAGEESAGAAFLRRTGAAWTTDKDGILLCLLAAEVTAVSGKSPSGRYQDLTTRFGDPVFARVDAPATWEQKAVLASLSPSGISATTLAGDPIIAAITEAPGNGASIGGVKVSSASGWFAARPSGTEDVYKIYAESFKGPEHLERIQEDATRIVAAALHA